MPQLATETFVSQIFWVLCGFALVYLFVSRVAFPELQDIMRNRITHIESLLKSAETTKNEAEELERESRIALENARFDATAKESQLMADFIEKSIEQKNDFYKRFDRESKEKSEELEVAVAQAFQEISKSSDELVKQIATAISKGGRHEH